MNIGMHEKKIVAVQEEISKFVCTLFSFWYGLSVMEKN